MDQLSARFEFYQSHLDRVSRSFAFCISRLNGDLREWVSQSYLFCRILDTIEDAPWKNLDKQRFYYQQLTSAFSGAQPLDAFENWNVEFPADIPDGEILLLKDLRLLLGYFRELPIHVQSQIGLLVKSMAKGMEYFAKKRIDGLLRLNKISELNQYCFFVAGIVGETVSHLFYLSHTSSKPSRQQGVQAHHLGLFLQKVNILKDERQDKIEGRSFFSSVEDVKASILVNAERAFSYIESLPLHRKDYRLFCLWSFFLGLSTLVFISNPQSPLDPRKLSRAQTENLMQQAELVVDSPTDLSLFYKSLMMTLVKNYPAPRTVVFSQVPNWVMEAYRGDLTREEISELELGEFENKPN